MSQDIELLERIDRYIFHSMKGEELAAMERALQDNPSLASQVEQQKLVHELVIGNRLNHVKGLMDAELFSEQAPKNVLPKRLTLITLALLSTIGVIGVLVLKESKQSTIPSKKENPSNTVDTMPIFKKESVKRNSTIGSSKSKTTLTSKDTIAQLSTVEVQEKISNSSSDISISTQNIKSENNKTLPIVVEKTTKKETDPIVVNPIVLDKKVEPTTKNEMVVPGETLSFSPTNGETAELLLRPEEEVQITITNRAGSLVWKSSSSGQDKVVWEGNDSSNGISVPGLYLYTLEYKSGKKVVGKIVVY